MSENPNGTAATPGKDRPYPWRCFRCRQKEVWPVVTHYECEIRHDSQLHKVVVPQLTVPQCRNCGERSFGNGTDDQIYAALRQQIHLLAPEQIRASREALGLSTGELTNLLGIAGEHRDLQSLGDPITMYEEGLWIHSRRVDDLLRRFFASPQFQADKAGAQRDS